MTDPIARFAEAMSRAMIAEKTDPTAMSLATAEARGYPTVRMVLLKGYDTRGFVFYTNRDSRKGEDLVATPYAGLCLYWPTMGEQIRIDGPVERVSDEESDAYFASRPRESQLGAWASRQSRPLEAHSLLLERWNDLQEMYADKPIPRPRWWGGYRVVPERMEFWKTGQYRLHHREQYLKIDGEWRSELLNP